MARYGSSTRASSLVPSRLATSFSFLHLALLVAYASIGLLRGTFGATSALVLHTSLRARVPRQLSTVPSFTPLISRSNVLLAYAT